MIAADATVDLPNNDGRTPLFYAAQNGHHEVVAALLAANATVDLAMSRRARCTWRRRTGTMRSWRRYRRARTSTRR